ncbi:MAG: acyl carrier protein [Betaproteobacteria bacterium]|nr:acyl carrier protein [Betaproteobacteria bacterium]
MPTPNHDITQLLTNFITTEMAARSGGDAPAPDFPIIEAGLVDSLGIFKLVAFIEEQFRVNVEPDEILFENFATINAITKLVRAKQSAPGAAGT